MYRILLFIASIVFPLLVNAQCPSNSITITTQAQIDNFNTTYSGCTAPTKSITITGSAIQNLNGLQNLTSLANLTVDRTGLANLTGLQNVTQITGNIDITQNPSMSNLTGLQNLVSIGGFLRLWMTPITSLLALQKLEYIGSIFTASHLLITDFSGLEKVTYLGYLTLTHNNNLTSLNGLHNAVASPYDFSLAIMFNNNLADCAIKYICFRRRNPPGVIGTELGANAPIGNCSDRAINAACYPITLPVTLIHFDAKKTRENQVALNWATSSETNSKLFQIEKNDGQGKWFALGITNAQFESSNTIQYSFTDQRPSNGTNLYRLKMVDMDNTFAYSKIVAVTFDGIKSNGVYPNPVADRFYLGEDDLKDLAQVNIINPTGQVLLTANKAGMEGFEVKTLPSGMYVVNVKKKDGKMLTYKIFKNK